MKRKNGSSVNSRMLEDVDVEIKEEMESSSESNDEGNVEVKEEKMDTDEEEQVDKDSKDEVPLEDEKCKKAKKKEGKPGIIYLSRIPPKMNIKDIREYFSKFGELNRSFLQPEKKPSKKKKLKNLTFTEGWIEFRKKRHAKRVAEMLNNQPVGGKKTKEYHDFLWNIKYLRGFLWVHLNERLAYERISQQHKVRAEISAAKRETAFFAKSVALSKRLKKKGALSKES